MRSTPTLLVLRRSTMLGSPGTAYVVMAVVLTVALLTAAAAPPAHADQIGFTWIRSKAENSSTTPPAPRGVPMSGLYLVTFSGYTPGIPGTHTTTGVVRRAGKVIATAYQPEGPGFVRQYAELQPGDVAQMSDDQGREITVPFTGYPTVNPVQCGAPSLTGATTSGQTVASVTDPSSERLNFFPRPPAPTVENVSGSYTAHFPTPLGAEDVVYLRAEEQLPPDTAVTVSIQVRVAGPCLGTAGAHRTRCIVPNLLHKTLTAARRLVAKARCKLGRITRTRRGNVSAAVVVRQKPSARSSMPPSTRISIQLA
jgi:hypothetical protein